ncbi:MAG: HAMP domain-containing histidine kinase [Flavobacteriales bacterium]|nr:HAMP domain-containing histidine kinase [Flavobacteriales bacterium]
MSPLKNLSYSNRIGLLYISSSALLLLLVFISIFQITSLNLYRTIENDLDFELQKHLEEIKIENNQIQLIHKEEWLEREHTGVEVNPVFVTFLNRNKELVEKSPNLKNSQLKWLVAKENKKYIDTNLEKNPIRQKQFEVFENQKLKGYVIVAMSTKNTQIVLQKLQNHLLWLYPLVLLALFFIARFFAGKSIQPVQNIRETAQSITSLQLSQRIPLPYHKDELYRLSETINDLLDKIEDTLQREKQFTSDASHELRTPLSVIKGTLEVLIRKPRTETEYQNKIKQCIVEINQMDVLLEELLFIARNEYLPNIEAHWNLIDLHLLIQKMEVQLQNKLSQKNIQIIKQIPKNIQVTTDVHLLEVLIKNILSNAIKYSEPNQKVEIVSELDKDFVLLKIIDHGDGIAAENLDKIFHSFYRVNSSNNAPKGYGIGLSIAKKIANILQIAIEVQSLPQQGTTFMLHIPLNPKEILS